MRTFLLHQLNFIIALGYVLMFTILATWISLVSFGQGEWVTWYFYTLIITYSLFAWVTLLFLRKYLRKTPKENHPDNKKTYSKYIHRFVHSGTPPTLIIVAVYVLMYIAVMGEERPQELGYTTFEGIILTTLFTAHLLLLVPVTFLLLLYAVYEKETSDNT